jgi:hypothetical protein
MSELEISCIPISVKKSEICPNKSGVETKIMPKRRRKNPKEIAEKIPSMLLRNVFLS